MSSGTSTDSSVDQTSMATMDAAIAPDASTQVDGRSDVSSMSDALPDGPNDAPTGCAGPLVWSKVPGSPAGFAISGSGPADIWLLGPKQNLASAGALMRGDGSMWNPVSAGDGGFVSGYALWVSGSNDVLVGEHTTVLHWNGSTWRSYDLADNRVVEHFWGTSPSDVWGSDDTLYLGHWDGQFWHFDGDFAAGPIAGGARGDFWAVEFDQLKHHALADANIGFSYDSTVTLASLGSDAGPCTSVLQCLYGGWASAPDDVWFVGEAGLALHYDGAMWSVEPLPVSATLRGIWGTSRENIWAVGDAGVLLHFDGTRWSQGPTLTTATLASVWMSGPCDAWTIGDAVYHGAPR